MKKKIFVGLLASALVCLAFVFTNASSNSFSVSGRVEMYMDGSSELTPASSALIEVYESSFATSPYISTHADGAGNFDIPNVRQNSIVHYSCSDDWGDSNTVTKVYTQENRKERIELHYTSHSN